MPWKVNSVDLRYSDSAHFKEIACPWLALRRTTINSWNILPNKAVFVYPDLGPSWIVMQKMWFIVNTCFCSSVDLGPHCVGSSSVWCWRLRGQGQSCWGSIFWSAWLTSSITLGVKAWLNFSSWQYIISHVLWHVAGIMKLSWEKTTVILLCIFFPVRKCNSEYNKVSEFCGSFQQTIKPEGGLEDPWHNYA